MRSALLVRIPSSTEPARKHDRFLGLIFIWLTLIDMVHMFSINIIMRASEIFDSYLATTSLELQGTVLASAINRARRK